MPRLFVTSLCIGLFALGCASSQRVPVSTAFDPLVQFPKQATFAWDREKISLPSDPELADLALGETVEQQAEAAFAARGYRRSRTEAADYRLFYDLRVDRFIAADRSSSTAVLSVTLEEARDGRRVWTGWGRSEFYVGATPEQRQTRIRQALDDMLVAFPPNQTPPE